MKKIPPQQHQDILQRHAAGQSDAAIARWLATLDPPIHVSRIAILQLRQKHLGIKPTPRQPTARPTSGKLSGAQGAKVRAARTAQEAKDHQKRGTLISQVPLETAPERAHTYAMRCLLEKLQWVNADSIMVLPEKIRQTVMIAQAMAKIRMEAELEKRIAELEQERAVEVEDLKAELRAVEVDRRRVEAERQQLDEEWAKLREERARFDALGAQITPLPPGS